MKKLAVLFLSGFLTFSLYSCRDDKRDHTPPKTEEQRLIDEMESKGADVKVKKDGETTKIKMETEDEKAKIKVDKDGNKKIKKKDKVL